MDFTSEIPDDEPVLPLISSLWNFSESLEKEASVVPVVATANVFENDKPNNNNVNTISNNDEIDVELDLDVDSAVDLQLKLDDDLSVDGDSKCTHVSDDHDAQSDSRQITPTMDYVLPNVNTTNTKDEESIVAPDEHDDDDDSVTIDTKPQSPSKSSTSTFRLQQNQQKRQKHQSNTLKKYTNPTTFTT